MKDYMVGRAVKFSLAVAAIVVLLVISLAGAMAEPASFRLRLVEAKGEDGIGRQALPNSSAVPAAHGQIAGRVTAETDGSPLPGITVYALGYDSTEDDWVWIMGEAQTDENGLYLIQNLDPDIYRVDFIDDSRGYVEEYFDNAPDSAHATDVLVAANQTTPNIDAALAPTGQITGVVTAEADGSSLANIEVDAWTSRDMDRPSGGHAITSGDGRYVIAGLDPGSYYVVFLDTFDDDYAGEYFDNVYDWANATKVLVKSGEATDNINAALALSGVITGNIAAEAGGAPLSGIFVQVSRYDAVNDAWHWAGEDRTESDGSYAVGRLAAGVHRVHFTGSDDYVGEYFDNAYEPENATDVLVVAGSTTPNIDAALAPPGQIAGKVTAELDGSPLAEIVVEAQRYNSATHRWEWAPGGYTGGDGHYRAPYLIPGKYRVYFFDYQHDFVREYYNDVLDPEDATHVIVTADQTTPDIDAALARPVRPNNDAIKDAIAIDAIPYRHAQDTHLATWSSGDPALSCADSSESTNVWYKVSPVQDGPVTISTADSDYDTVLALLHREGGKLTNVACNDDYQGSQSQINHITLQAEATYFIQVASKKAQESGVLVLSLRESFAIFAPVIAGGTLR